MLFSFSFIVCLLSSVSLLHTSCTHSRSISIAQTSPLQYFKGSFLRDFDTFSIESGKFLSPLSYLFKMSLIRSILLCELSQSSYILDTWRDLSSALSSCWARDTYPMPTESLPVGVCSTSSAISSILCFILLSFLLRITILSLS